MARRVHPRSKLVTLLKERLTKSKVSKAATKELEEHAQRTPTGSLLRQIILGGQDGVVNVLGIALGVASATNDPKLVLISGLAGTFAESISMAAVAYTSARAMQDHYKGEVEREKWEMAHLPEVEKEEVRLIYMKKGFRGKTLEDVVRKITSSKRTWLEAMVSDELGLGAETKKINPTREAAVVGLSSLAGSLIPIIPFALIPVWPATLASVIVSAAVLFLAGWQKARMTVGSPLKSGLEMALIGGVAALAGYLIGSAVGRVI
ncbi:MAG: VIT1/CCC1 transporter family protein [Candidatus Micrarchaeia archaeon]